MWPTRGPRYSLPVERAPYGLVQRGAFTHAELVHEELLDTASPLLLEAPADTVLYTALVLGERNAGKTSFLYAFVDDNDAHWSALACALPVLTASFANVRLTRDMDAPHMSEPPWLDTDVARCTLLVEADVFAVWADEHELLSPPAHARYVLVQLVELGGDHLERLMAPPGNEPAEIAVILDQSRALLASAHTALYLVNGIAVDDALAQRLDYLAQALLPPSSLTVVITRTNDAGVVERVRRAAPSSVSGVHVVQTRKDGAFDYDEVLRLLALAIATSTSEGVEALVARYLFRVAQRSLSRTLTANVLIEHAEDDPPPMPPALCLQRAEHVADLLAERAICLSSFSIRLSPSHGDSLLLPVTFADTWWVRFPPSPVLDALVQLATLPEKALALDKPGGDLRASIRANLIPLLSAPATQVLSAVETRVHDAWSALKPGTDEGWEAVGEALADWFLVARLLSSDGLACPLLFPHELPLPAAQWEALERLARTLTGAKEGDALSECVIHTHVY